MKRFLWISAGFLALTSVAWMQVDQSTPSALASMIPAGPMIYLEAKDFRSLLNEWNQSGIKQTWLGSANRLVFANSNLLQKLDGLYQEYGNVAGFLPGLPGVMDMAGRESALGLYDLREQHFVYITRVEESQLTKSQLWRVREKFATREANGTSFYLRRDDASNRTVAFAFTNGWLVLATRDDLMANTLALLARKQASSLAGEPWFAGALAQAGTSGELRMALNMQLLVADSHFRSYWIQRNISQLRPFLGGLADLQRTASEVRENRVFVRQPEQTITVPPESALDSLAGLRALAPADAALVRAWAAPSVEQVESLLEAKLLKPTTESGSHGQLAPDAASTDQTAGSEQDLETRIDEPPLSSDVAGTLKSGALKELIAQGSPDALLQIQTTVAAGKFLRTPSVVVISASAEWDAGKVREALSSAVESLWSTSRLGVEFQRINLGSHSIEQLNGLASLQFAIEGKRLFLGNDLSLLQATLDRVGTAPLPRGASYSAEFRHAREQGDYLRLAQALDFGATSQLFFSSPQGDRTPHFFSENVASLSATLNFVKNVSVTYSQSSDVERQQVIYQH